jgi:hypothetical protein
VTVNSFLEDTAVLVATAFLIVRGPFERMLANPILSGVAFGVLAGSEAVFPNSRFPYASHTLGCSFIAALAGWRAGLIAALTAWIITIGLCAPNVAELIGLQLVITLFILCLTPKPRIGKATFMVLLIAVSQAACVASSRFFYVQQPSLISPWTILANTFGAILLGLVIKDARIRGQAELNRAEIAAAKTRAVEVQLLMLRGRVHPHFLYNALTSIAALCDIAPKRASKAAINLGSLMRESLEHDLEDSRLLSEELETVRTYADIELERYGPKLQVEYHVGECADVMVPPFSIQILIENAILHGVSRLSNGGRVLVVARKNRRFAFIAVVDNGVGLSNRDWRTDSHHGLTILESLIRAQSRPGGRFKIVRRLGGGTLAVIRMPLGDRITK